jgi:hypothetical protein
MEYDTRKVQTAQGETDICSINQILVYVNGVNFSGAEYKPHNIKNKAGILYMAPLVSYRNKCAK